MQNLKYHPTRSQLFQDDKEFLLGKVNNLKIGLEMSL